MKYPWMAALILLAGCDSIGGHDNVVNGNGNVLGNDTVTQVAKALARFETTPEVSDADLQAIYAGIRQAAADGDLQASLVVLEVAGIQRAPEPDDE